MDYRRYHGTVPVGSIPMGYIFMRSSLGAQTSSFWALADRRDGYLRPLMQSVGP